MRHAVRLHWNSPGVSLVALSTLSIGIGLSAVLFSAVSAILLEPLPYPEPGRIVIPWRLAPKDANLGYNEIPWGTANFQDLRKLRSFESIAAFKSDSFNLTGSGEPEKLEGLRVSSGFFPVLEVAPMLGRPFTANEDVPGGSRRIILSYQLWQTRFHADPGILGRAIDLNNLPHTVIGVMPAGFEFPRAEEMPGSFDFPRHAQFWIALGLPSDARPGEPDELAVIGRLARGVSIASAQAEMNLFTTSTERRFPESKGWFNSRVTGLTEQVVGDTRKPLLLILSAVGVLLVIACMNVAGLFLTRSLGRRSEFAVRAALGAGKTTLLRQLLAESTVLSVAGGIGGLVIAEAGIRLVKAYGPSSVPRLQDVALDWRVLAFTFTIALLCAALFGLAPAAGLLSENLAMPLRAGGRGGTGNSGTAKLRALFLIAEVALALILVVASGLLVRTFFHLLGVNPGFQADRVLTFELSLPNTKYKDEAHIVGFYKNALEALRQIPGVTYAGLVETVPMAGASDGSLIRLPGRNAAPGKEPFANYNIASPDYFSAVGTPLLRGRGFRDSDLPSSTPVVVVNSTMAGKFWPGEDPIGRRVGLADPSTPLMEIVGVSADVKHLSLREETGPEMYVPFTQKPFPSMLVMHVVVRARMDPALLIPTVREQLRRLDQGLPLANVTRLSTLVDRSLAGQRFSVWLISIFGIVSLILASIGLYGVISYSVAQRTREIGIRMALGARKITVITMVLRQGACLIGAGVVAGLIGAFAAARLMANALYGVPPTDMLTFSTAVPSLVAVALAACYAPARRAAQVEPVTAIRHE